MFHFVQNTETVSVTGSRSHTKEDVQQIQYAEKIEVRGKVDMNWTGINSIGLEA